MIIHGKVHKFGNNIDTDVIIPARYLNTTDPFELAKHCMEDIDKNFSSEIETGDIIVAGRNFGCGSSREHAPLAIKHCGISSVIAESFSRIFYRNAINIGLPIFELEDATKKIKKGDELEIDIEKGKIKNLTKKETYTITPFPDFIMNIIKAGGLLEYIKKIV